MTPGVEFDDQNDIAEYVCGRAENVQDHNGQDRDHDDQDHDHLHLYHLLLLETTIIFLFESQTGDVNSFFGDYNSILLKTIIKYFVAHVNHEKHSGAENLGIGLDVKGNGMPVVYWYFYIYYIIHRTGFQTMTLRSLIH